MRRTTRKTLLYILPATILVSAGLLSLCAQTFVFPADAEPGDWKPAGDFVADRIQEGDLVRTHPPWNADGLPYLESVGDQVDRRRDPLLEDIYRADRIWILTETGRLEGAVRRLPFDPVDPTVEKFGDVSVVRTTLPKSADFSWEALEHLSEARVERVTPGGDEEASIRECTNWDSSDRRWDCGSRDPWLYVGETLRHLGGDPRRAIWAHPLPGNERLRVTFPEMPVGDQLRVRAGFTFKASLKDRGRDVTMEVRLDGETLDEKNYPKLESTWEPLEFDTSKRAGETAKLTVVVRTTNVTDRYFCFNAWVW